MVCTDPWSSLPSSDIHRVRHSINDYISALFQEEGTRRVTEGTNMEVCVGVKTHILIDFYVGFEYAIGL